MKKLTQCRLKELLHYNKETGIFTWNIQRQCVKKGMIAGYKSEQGYIVICIDGKRYLAHRLAFLYMNGKFPDDYTDHINHIEDDNRWCNLRIVTHAENHRNRGLSKNNKSGVNGVCWKEYKKGWEVQITANSKKKYIGLFKNKKEAIKARQEANIKYGYHPNHGLKSLSA